MQPQNNEILSVIVIGGIMAVALLLFIMTVLFLYQKRQHRHEKELVKLKEEYDQELLRSQLEIQEGTLKTIAQELHDNIGQMLSVVRLSLATVGLEKTHPAYEGVENSREILNRAIVDVSNLTKSLHTDRIAQIGLREAVQFEVETIRKSGLVNIDFSSSGTEQDLDPQKSIFLFRMFQEILNNTLKHSRATLVTVAVSYTDRLFTLRMEDNGIGFNVEEKKNKPSASGGVGLKSMINRAKLVGCDFVINSVEGKGTSVSISLPLGEKQSS